MKALLRKIRQILRDRRVRRFFTRVVSTLAAIVVFVTTYALVLPAITLERVAACGIEEHQHTDDCWSEVLICDIPESDGHEHNDDCYSETRELVCEIPEHVHSVENGCYDEDGNLVCSEVEHTHGDGCYKEVRTLTCKIPESEGHHHDSSCYEKVLTCGKEYHVHSAACYKDDAANSGSTESAAVAASTGSAAMEDESGSASTGASTGAATGATSGASTVGVNADEAVDDAAASATTNVLPEEVPDESLSAGYVPQLEPVDMDTVLNKQTGFYYFDASEYAEEHAAEDGTVDLPANSAEIEDWKEYNEKNDKLEDSDLLRLYLSYTIPAGTLNETNQVSRYRLPSNIRLTDDQIVAINETVNGIAGQYMDMSTLEITNPEKYEFYRGAEAIEGSRTPDVAVNDYLYDLVKAGGSGEEYISAVVKVENVFDEHSGEWVGQDLIFIWTPYSIEKNQNEYDTDGQPTKAGEKITGWFACDFNCGQIEWEDGSTEATEDTENETVTATAEKTADVVFVEKDNAAGTKEISQTLTMVEQTVESDPAVDDHSEESGEAATEDAAVDSTVDDHIVENEGVEQASTAATDTAVNDQQENEEAAEYQSGTLTATGESYTITLDYTAEAEIPADAQLKVTEITEESDPEAYKSCLETASREVASDEKTTVDETASRFFDIEIQRIIVNEDGQEKVTKIEPKAPVAVNIQLIDTPKTVAEMAEEGAKNLSFQQGAASDPTVLHFAEDGVETLESTTGTLTPAADNNEQDDGADHVASVDNVTQQSEGTAIQFETSSFSIYGVVYTSVITTSYISALGETYEITVTYGEDAQIPDGAELKVREILSEDEKYAEFYQQASEVALNDAESQGMEYPVVAGAHLFDIEIRSGERKIEPAAPVQVDIRLVGTEADLLSVVHFAEEGPEAMAAEKGEVSEDDTLLTDIKATRTEEADNAETTDIEAVVNAVTFRADAFSVYTVVSVNNDKLAQMLADGPYALVSQNGPGIYAVGENNTNTSTDIMKYALTDTTTTADGGSALKGKVVYFDTSVTPNLVGGDVTEWYFEPVQDESGRYRIYTLDGSNNRHYIKSSYNPGNGIAYLATDTSDGDHFVITVSDGKVRIYLPVDGFGNWYITNLGSNPSYFRETSDNANNNSTLFTLAKLDRDYEEKAARKVSASDWKAAEGVSGRWNESSTVVIYRRILHDDGNENLYALATDGSWIPANDGGDSIFYHCPEGKSVDWHVTHTDQGYYISNIGNTVYLAPSYSNGQWSSTTPVGLTVRGLDSKNDYGSAIEVWDQAAYAYAGLHLPLDELENVMGNVEPGTGENDDVFLFAVSETLISDGTRHPVDTVDSASMGITMKIFDYGGNTYWNGYRNYVMQGVMGDDMLDDWDTRKSHVTKTVKSTLGDDGFPVSLSNGNSYAPLFALSGDGDGVAEQGGDANHLFLQSYYDENGMFRYSSMENFAHFNISGEHQGDFTVYRETGTPNIPTASDHYYFYHGHFMPYNDLDPTVSVSRIVDQYGSPEEKEAGRSYENIYGLSEAPNYYVGMSMEANFVQPHGGTLANGDPVIYRFTGDDDLLVYIDGVLVLDVGGIHEPLTGSINFETGKVYQPNFYGHGDGWEQHEDTIYNIFNRAHKNGDIDDTAWNRLKWKDVDGDGTPDTFDDYTTHNFKMFYMERGAGASNLDLAFNLQVVKPNEFTVKKELPEDVDTRFVNHTYKYKATFIDKNDVEQPLYKDVRNSDGTEVCTAIVYKDLRDPVTGQPIEKEVVVDSNGYFYLKPDETAMFTMANEHIQYNVREVTINETEISRVDINNTQAAITTSSVSADGREAVAGTARVEERSSVIYKNYPYTRALNITKHLTDDSAPLEPGEMPVFEFRVYLESTVTEGNPPTEVHKLVPYSYGSYYVTKEVNGVTHYYTLTGINNAPEDQGTTPVICSETGRSGSINSIPPEYTVVIPNLMVGTHFYVEERRDNIPAGYSFDREVLTPDTFGSQTLGTENEIISRVLARDTQYEDPEHEQPFDIETVGKIISTADAESHVYNRKETVDVPVEKVWSPTPSTTPEPVTMALVRFKLPEPEVHYTPAQGKGAVRINHVAHYGVDSENDASLPGGFVARYTITNKTSGEVIIHDTTERGPFDLDAGQYTVTATVVRSADPEDYAYVKTDSVDVTVVVDQTETVKLTSVYREEKSGFIEITHVASGLEGTTELPANFTGTYSIRNSSGQFIHSYVPAGTYAVAPGNYTVIANITDPAAPNEYSYESTSNVENVTVVSGETTPAELTSVYAKNGTLTFSHTADGLDTTTLPPGFTATYTISGPTTINNAQPGQAYSVAPGVYKVTARVTNPAAPSGKTYVSTSSVEDVTVTSGGSEAPGLVSTYMPTPEDGYVVFVEEFVDTEGKTLSKPENFGFGYDISGPTSYQSVPAGQRRYVEPGAYTFSANKWNDGSNDSYTYVETVIDPASTTITGGLTTVTVTHRYSRVLEKGSITIVNKSVDLPNSPVMPANFSANYQIVDDSTNEVVNGLGNVQAGTEYPVAPGRYRIELVSVGYEGNNVAPYTRTSTPNVTVDVGEAEYVTAEVKHYYEVSGNATATVHVRVDHNGGDANTSAVLTEVPKNTSVYLSYSDFTYAPWGNQYSNPGWELFYYDDSSNQWRSTGIKKDSNGAGSNTEIPIGLWDKYCIAIKFNPLDDAISQINPQLTLEPISVSALPDANAPQLALNSFATHAENAKIGSRQDINPNERSLNATLANLQASNAVVSGASFEKRAFRSAANEAVVLNPSLTSDHLTTSELEDSSTATIAPAGASFKENPDIQLAATSPEGDDPSGGTGGGSSGSGGSGTDTGTGNGSSAGTSNVTDINPMSVEIPQSVTDGLPAGAGYTLDVSFGKGIVLNGNESPEAWKQIVSKLAEYDIYGTPYYYAIVETSVPEGYEVSYSNPNPISAVTIRQNMDARAAAQAAGTEPPSLVTLQAINTRDKVPGNLVIEKKVSGLTDTSSTFTFQITLTSSGTGSVNYTAVKTKADNTVDAAVTSVTFTDGTATVSLKANEKIVIQGLPDGTTYAVTETGTLPAGYEQGTHTNASGTIHDSQTTTVTMNNIYTVSLDIVKVDETNTSKKIPGAQFTIRRIKDTLGGNGVEYDGAESDPITTDGNGTAQFTGIRKGYYEVYESRIPDGYVTTGDNRFYIFVDEGNIRLLVKNLEENELKNWTSTQTIVGNVSLAAKTATVTNEPGAELPASGGMGTRLIYLLGGMLTGIALLLLPGRKRIRA